MNDRSRILRRSMLRSAAGLAIAQLALHVSGARAAQPEARGPGDFAFLTGEWTIRNRRRTEAESGAWDTFDGEATVVSAMGGMASIEDLRIPARGFFGMGVRVYHVHAGVWADHWVSGKNGVVNEPMLGKFEGGVGTFTAEETSDGKSILARGVWDRVTPGSCRWHQATSTDGGATWDVSWEMDWTRA